MGQHAGFLPSCGAIAGIDPSTILFYKQFNMQPGPYFHCTFHCSDLEFMSETHSADMTIKTESCDAKKIPRYVSIMSRGLRNRWNFGGIA